MDEYTLIELKNWFGTKTIICQLLATNSARKRYGVATTAQ